MYIKLVPPIANIMLICGVKLYPTINMPLSHSGILVRYLAEFRYIYIAFKSISVIKVTSPVHAAFPNFQVFSPKGTYIPGHLALEYLKLFSGNKMENHASALILLPVLFKSMAGHEHNSLILTTVSCTFLYHPFSADFSANLTCRSFLIASISVI